MKINRKRFEAYRKAHGREVFRTKEATYDITLAQFLCEQRQGHAVSVDVEALATAIGYDQRPIEEDGLLFYPSGVVLEHAHVQRDLDLEKPLLLAHGQLIDGHHRLYRAFLLGLDELKAYELTREEVGAITS